MIVSGNGLRPSPRSATPFELGFVALILALYQFPAQIDGS